MRLSGKIYLHIAALFLGFMAIRGSAQTTVYLYRGAETNITLNPGLYIIAAYGTQGGSSTYNSMGGLGAEMEAEFNFTSMTALTLLVGGVGPGEYYAGGGEAEVSLSMAPRHWSLPGGAVGLASTSAATALSAAAAATPAARAAVTASAAEEEAPPVSRAITAVVVAGAISATALVPLVVVLAVAVS
jgi:hypothetical protein